MSRWPTRVLAPISIGELVDKITILEIKEEHSKGSIQLQNVRRELLALRGMEVTIPATLSKLVDELKGANRILWDVEDKLREYESRGEFGDGFVSLARLVYQTNDRRAAIKKEINLLMNSDIVEEKIYAAR